VSLFSGGLDSLCGVIDLLEADPALRLGLAAHYDGGHASSKQSALHERLADVYGAHRVVLRRLWLRPAAAHPRQEHPSPPPVENTTRGRSLLFLASALALASSVSPQTPVYLPENGYIALNVPLTRARTGSASTRTTHPHFLRLLAQAALAAGVPNPLINPCALRTKGEMLRDSRNPDLLRELAPLTVSCSHPEAARMQERPQGNCGYCFPCLIRRASLAVPGWDDDEYAWDALTDSSLIDDIELQRGADLRAVLNGAFAERPDSDLLRNAPLPPGTHADHLAVWRRGNAELQSWLKAGARGSLAAVIAQLP
jgi:7-cyano-7-deazaguanine synthase in queuosine biosynthesis